MRMQIAGWSVAAFGLDGDGYDVSQYPEAQASAQAQGKEGRYGAQPMPPELASLPWTTYLEGAGFPELATKVGTEINVPNSFVGLSWLLERAPTDVVKAYLTFMLTTSTAEIGTQDMWRHSYNFRAQLQALLKAGDAAPPPLHISNLSALTTEEIEIKCLEQLEDHVPFLLGKFFSEAVFPEESQRYATRMLELVQHAFRNELTQGSAWMDKDTRANAIDKLEAMNNKIGYPSQQKLRNLLQEMSMLAQFDHPGGGGASGGGGYKEGAARRRTARFCSRNSTNSSAARRRTRRRRSSSRRRGGGGASAVRTPPSSPPRCYRRMR